MTHELNRSSWSEITFRTPNLNYFTTEKNRTRIVDVQSASLGFCSRNLPVSISFAAAKSYYPLIRLVGKMSLTTYDGCRWVTDFSKTLIGLLFCAFSQVLSTFKNVVFLTADTSLSVGIKAHELSLYSFTFKSLVK